MIGGCITVLLSKLMDDWIDEWCLGGRWKSSSVPRWMVRVA